MAPNSKSTKGAAAKAAEKKPTAVVGTPTKNVSKKQENTQVPQASSITPKKKTPSRIKPSKGAVSLTSGKKGGQQINSKEHTVKYYVFNENEAAHAVGVVVHGGRNLIHSSWLSRVVDNIVRKGTDDFDPIPFFDGTFYLFDEDAEIMKNDRNQ